MHLTQVEASANSPAAGRGLPQVLWQRRYFFALGSLLGLAAGLLYYALSKPVYQSSAQLLVVKKRPDALTGSPAAAAAAPEDYVSTHQALLKSPLAAERAARKLEQRGVAWAPEAGDSPADAIVKKLTATRSKDPGGTANNVVTLSVRGPGADECNAVLEAVIESYRDIVEESYTRVSDSTLDLITRARDVLRDELAGREEAYREFRQKAPLLWKGKEGVNSRQERLNSIESKRTALLLRRAELQGQLDAIETALAGGRSRETLLAMIYDLSAKADAEGARPSAPLNLREQLLPLLMEEEKLQAKYGPDHPELKAVRRRIEVARELLTRPSAAFGKPAGGPGKEGPAGPLDPVRARVDFLKQELEHLTAAERLLAALAEGEHDEAKKLSDHELQDEAYRADIARTQQLYESIIKRLQDAGFAKEFGGYESRVIAPPGSGGVKKINPSVLIALALTVLVGLAGGCGLVYLAEVADKTFRSPDEVRRRLGAPVLGHIPLFRPDRKAVRPADLAGAGLDPILCTYHRPQSAEAEAYRGVLTALCFGGQGQGPRVLQITSPKPGDGKTTFAANLAVSLAQSGRRVLLVDADFRRPRLHQVFGLAAKPGLASVLAGETGLEDVIRPGGVDGLRVLPGGPPSTNPAELLTSPRFQEVVEALREGYDFVLLDTPPLLSVSDPCAVAGRVDGVLFTLHATHDARPEAELAKGLLDGLGARVIGVVVNGVGRKGSYRGHPYDYQLGQREPAK